MIQGGVLTSSGGTLRTSGGELELVAPAGALDAPTVITLAVTAGAPWVDPTLVRGAVFSIGRGDQRFAKPVTVRARYLAANALIGLSQSALGLRQAQLVSSSWADIRASVVDSVAGRVTATISEGGL